MSEFALYVSVSFLEYSFVEGVALPAGLQLRLMPGDLVVPDTESLLLYPPSLDSSVLPHLRCLEQSQTLHGIGVRSLSVFTLTRLPPVWDAHRVFRSGAPDVGVQSTSASAGSAAVPLLAAAGVAGAPLLIDGVPNPLQPAIDLASQIAQQSSLEDAVDSQTTDPATDDLRTQVSSRGSGPRGDSPALSPPATDSYPDEASEMCDCLRCTHVALKDVVVPRGGFRCAGCLLTQFDPCPCTCAGCWSPDGIRVRCALPGCFDFGSVSLLTHERERCCGLPHELMLMRLEQCPSVCLTVASSRSPFSGRTTTTPVLPSSSWFLLA